MAENSSPDFFSPLYFCTIAIKKSQALIAIRKSSNSIYEITVFFGKYRSVCEHNLISWIHFVTQAYCHNPIHSRFQVFASRVVLSFSAARLSWSGGLGEFVVLLVLVLPEAPPSLQPLPPAARNTKGFGRREPVWRDIFWNKRKGAISHFEPEHWKIKLLCLKPVKNP